MATWKKVIVSGSTANLAALQVDNLTSGQVVIGGGTAGNLSTTAINGTGNIVATTNATGLTHSGSFSGSFQGNGTGLTGVTATPSFPNTAITNLSSTDKFFVNDDAGDATSGNKKITYANLLTDLAGTNLSVESSDSLTLATTITGLTSVSSTSFTGSLLGTASTASFVTTAQTASFVTTAQTASFVTGSIFTSTNPALSASFASTAALASTVTTNANLTGDVTSIGNATTLATVASAGTTGGSTAIPVITINAKGLTTSITTAAVVAPAGTLTGNTLASGVLASSLTSVGTLSSLTATNAVITNNLTVQGTASFQQTTNLEVADRFVLFASGSNTTGDGGIVVQQGTQNVGELYGYDSATNRWAFTSSFSANQSSFTPAAYITTTEFAAANPSAAPIYGGASNGFGNIHVNSSTGDIFIYA